jgi:hypothetical protein
MKHNHSVYWKLDVIVPAVLVASGAFTRPSSASKSGTGELWAGHQVVFGEADVPVLGKRETRSDSYLLARVTKRDGKITITQKACKVDFQEVLGTKIRIPEKALLDLPPATFSFVPDRDGLRATPWEVGWGRQDVDRDGKPGLTVEVDASVCGGKLYVASTTKSAASGRMLDSGEGMMGKISVRVRQEILDADSACLRMFASDSDEIQTGGFIYRRVADNASCRELLRHPWPVEVKVKR